MVFFTLLRQLTHIRNHLQIPVTLISLLRILTPIFVAMPLLAVWMDSKGHLTLFV